MIIRITTLVAVLLLIFQTQGYAVVKTQQETQAAEKTSLAAKFKEKVKTFTAKQQHKMEKRMAKIQKKLDRQRDQINQNSETSGVRLGIVLALIGLLLAVLGFAGIAEILVTIGIVVLVVGLILWLIQAI